MDEPEPLDELPVTPAETRGGDRLADISAVDVTLYPQTNTRNSGGAGVQLSVSGGTVSYLQPELPFDEDDE